MYYHGIGLVGVRKIMKPSMMTNVAKIQTQTPPKYRPEALSHKADQISYNKCKINGQNM